MKNYTDSDYALNKYCDGIIYRFTTSTDELTLEAFLASDPKLTEQDFKHWKNWSDTDYETQVRDENTQTKKDISFRDLDGHCCIKSPEDELIGEIDAQDEAAIVRRRMDVAKCALEKLSEIQRRRYLLYAVCGLKELQIAELEHTTQQSISKSLVVAKNKIKKNTFST